MTTVQFRIDRPPRGLKPSQKCERSDMIPTHCLACGFPITLDNFSPVNSLFHRICMDEGVYVDFDRTKYSESQIADTWAKRRPL